MEKNKNLSFSTEVAETLGLESAIILDLYKNNKLENISSYQSLINSVCKHLSFIDKEIIEASVKKLLNFDFIEIKELQIKNKYEVQTPNVNKESDKLDKSWMPSSDTKEILNMSEITDEFYDIKLKEFKIYWIERGQKKNNWNMTFLNFIRREWSKEINSNKVLPYTINENWYPDEDVFDILYLSDITKDSALKYLREFNLYWKDNGSAFTTWNSKFIDHVKRRHMLNDNIIKNEENKKYTEPGEFKQNFKTRKNDRSWAKDINLD